MLGLLAMVAIPAVPQTPSSVRLVMPQGDGSILVNTAVGYEFEQLALYDQGTRASLLVDNKTTGLNISYVLMPTDYYTDTTEKCRNSVISGVIEGALQKATLTNEKNDTRKLPNGQTIAIASYVIEKNLGVRLDQTNIFGFFVSGSTCAEIHISKVHVTKGDTPLLKAALDSFNFDLAYEPTVEDYKALSSFAMHNAKDVSTADIYDKRATELGAPPSPSSLIKTATTGLNFSLATHPGHLHMYDPGFEITELSAKPDGIEFGIRAHNKVNGTEILSFLYLPSDSPSSADECREQQLKAEDRPGFYRKIIGRRELTSTSGVPVAIVSYDQAKKPAPYSSVIRAFVASKGLCADIEFTGKAGISPGLIDTLLSTVSFNPDQQPSFMDKFAYATVLYDHHAFAAAAPIFESTIPFASTTDDPTTWSRVAVDQASMAYGISGNLAKSRAVNEAAIARDPLYPLYYYNLACADAEEGNAGGARTHLEQAFARRANTLKGETMPDPAKDDSILKLKSDKDFWAFVESLSESESTGPAKN